MPGEDHDAGGVSFALPPEVDDWIAAEADRRDEPREDVCRRLVAAAHAVSTDDDASVAVDPVDRDDLESLESQLDAQHEEFTELLEDVRSRVVQVKRETDEKAPADHDHDEYAADADLDGLADDLAEFERRLDAGFENFEEILERLLGRTTDLEDRSTVLANAVLELRDRRRVLAEREEERAAVERLQLAANRLGISTASCEECSADVDLALLTEPECPHCAAAFADVAEKTSFFGSHTLVTGDPPALEGAVETASDQSTAAVFDAVEDDTTSDRQADPAESTREQEESK
ncbi:hypothetical protein ACLI4Z_06090 [Natrialbaceae archaeon A-arb3/5]